MSQDSGEVPPIVHALSGAVASIFSNSFVYPLDLVTTRLQTQDHPLRRSRRDSGTALTHDKHYDGLAHALFTIYEDEGPTRLWQGVWADNVSTMTSTFCYHFAYNIIRDARLGVAARKNGGKRPAVLGMVEELGIGAAAGIIARFTTSPLSNVVTRTQTQGGEVREIVKSIYKEKGVTGFWSGMKASVILAANPSISYYLFELQKALLIPKSRRSRPKAVEIFLMSATGKAIATLALYPVILVKARTQALRAKSGIWEIVKGILEKDGLAGLYEGAIPQVLKGFLSQGILMLLKERIARFIITAYLALARRQARAVKSGDYYFSDSPKTDVNGLIAATKDRVEVAVDQAVAQVKDVAGTVAESIGVDQIVDNAKGMAQSVRESTGLDTALEKAAELATSARDQVAPVTTSMQESAQAAVTASAQSIKDLSTAGREKAAGLAVSARDQVAPVTTSIQESAQAAVTASAQSVKDLSTAGRERLAEGLGAAQEYVQGSQEPARAVCNAVEQGKMDSPEWSQQTRSTKKE